MNTVKYEMSKTYQYRKVMKPMLERKRRARINKCLNELKDLISECMQQRSGEANVKLEKADILELTVQHLRKIKQSNAAVSSGKSFRTGYSQAANEVSKCLATLPKVDITLGTKLMTHLGLRLNELVSGTPQMQHAPLNIHCGNDYSHSHSSNMLSPVSSGYGSDSEYSVSPSSCELLLKVAISPTVKKDSQYWRPW